MKKILLLLITILTFTSCSNLSRTAKFEKGIKFRMSKAKVKSKLNRLAVNDGENSLVYYGGILSRDRTVRSYHFYKNRLIGVTYLAFGNSRKNTFNRVKIPGKFTPYQNLTADGKSGKVYTSDTTMAIDIPRPDSKGSIISSYWDREYAEIGLKMFHNNMVKGLNTASSALKEANDELAKALK